MRLGIDFGTTRTLVAVSDRGNFPVVGFEAPDGSMIDHWPTVVASDGRRLVFGHDAVARLHEPGWTAIRSVKRLLAGAGPGAMLRVGDHEHPVHELLAGFLSALRADLLERSNLPVPVVPGEPIEARVAVPAGASSAQRMMTLDAFGAAGFRVVGLLNEPSAAGLEYAHRYRKTLTANREDVLVYDLGGGTFDVSLVRMAGGRHEVLAHAGDNHLGGDDFDAVLLDLALESAGRPRPEGTELVRALEHCRAVKEALNANSKRVTVDLDEQTAITLPTAEYYARCEALVDRSLDAVARVLPAGTGADRFDCDALAGVYVVGGASDLPVVARRLKEVFGRRVKRSAYPSGATAVGLAIAFEEDAPAIDERFGRTFGVFRELAGGTGIVFDPILTPDQALADDGGEKVRRYRAMHNVGCFRFAECDRLEQGQPTGDLLPWGVVRFPFDASLQGDRALDDVPVERLDAAGPVVEERYRVEASGVVQVRITDLATGFSREHRLGL